MEDLEHSLYIVELFNKIFAKPLAWILSLFGIQIKNPEHFIPNTVVMCIIAATALIIFFFIASKKLQLVPSKIQSFLELLYKAFENQLIEIIGQQGSQYVPLVATIGIFIFTSNLLGLIPGLMSPTSNLNVTAACALVVFVYYHWQGVKSQGILKYLKHFFGPIPFLAPLMLPIEIISHFSRVVSLSIRLFGNIFAEELLIVVMISIIPFFLPLPFMAVAIFTAFIQAFVFVMLTCIYLAGAVAQEEEH
ncbi:MAG: F0F1 ATP synthase subunit A [Candidatus Aminicenantes bacterium]|nr:F0F1 ATP synthase subunit A [Candidatus Aminicenantes bacterium]